MVAIIGMGFIFPGGVRTKEALWKSLISGTDHITTWPDSRKPLYSNPELAPKHEGGYIDDVDRFDAGMFRINGREATYMDPQQRLLLETTWEAIEDAAISPKSLAGSETGVFAGAHTTDYHELLCRQGEESNAYWNAGLNGSMLANRISYCFDLHGPSLGINTACSSGLEALHRAVEAIRHGECDMALAVGVTLILTPSVGAGAERAGMLSPSFRCKTFDQSADGFVRSEGVAAILLKSQEQAEKDGDPIYTTIQASTSRHGGRANSITSPNLNQQRELLERTWAKPKHMSSRDLNYVECHGTGTKLGDSIEIEALKEAYTSQNPDGPAQEIPIGSIKSNFGHMEAASGLAGVIKVCLAMEHRQIPGLVHFRQLSPLIELEGSPFTVSSHLTPMPSAGPLRAGVSSFGFGGSYAHVLLESASPDPQEPQTTHDLVFPLSARDQDRLAESAKRLLHWLRNSSNETPQAIAHTLQTGRAALSARVAFIAGSPSELADRVEAWLNNPKTDHCFSGTVPERGRKAPAEFSGNQSAESLARFWVAGGEPDWRNSHPENQQPQKIHLPTYPFFGKSFWAGSN